MSTRIPQIPQNVYILAVTWSSSDVNTLCCVLPVLWMTSCFHMVREKFRDHFSAYERFHVGCGGEQRMLGSLICLIALYLHCEHDSELN